jgi:hypothetical protein
VSLGARIAGVLASAVGVTLLCASPAYAEPPVTKAQCIDANTQAQSLRRDGKFTQARAQLQKCGDGACPAIIRDDCTDRLDELEKAQPTIVFDGKDGDGHDLVAVAVTADGQPFADKLQGTALRIDPGAHTFVFTAANQPPVTQTFVIREGEKQRHETIVIGKPTAPAAPIAPATPAPTRATPDVPPDHPSSSGLGTQKLLGIGIGGLGVLGLGVGTVFGVLASSAWSNAKNACGGDISHCADPSTANSDKNTTNLDGTLSTVGFIAGGALVAAGAVLFFTAHTESSTTASLAVSPTVGPREGGVAVLGRF